MKSKETQLKKMRAAANLRRNGQNSLRDNPRMPSLDCIDSHWALMGQGMWTAAGAGHARKKLGNGLSEESTGKAEREKQKLTGKNTNKNVGISSLI